MASSSSNGLEGVFLAVFQQAESRWAGGNGCGNERQLVGEGIESAHNGVRGDDGVEVTEASE